MSPNYSGFALASFAIAISPGASWMYVITSTAGYGRSGGLVAVAGNGLGILTHVVAALLGVATVLQYSPNAFAVLKLIGVAYLLYLAIRTVRESTTVLAPDSHTAASYSRIFKGGVLVNATNPKAALLMLALLPQFVDVSSQDITTEILICGLIHIAVASCVLSTLSFAANLARNSLRNRNVDRMFRWTSAVILVGLGLKLAYASV